MICLFINMLRVNPVLAVKCYIFKNGGGWNLFRCKLEFVISRLIVLVFYCTIYRHIYIHQVWFFFLEKLIVIHSYRPRCLAIDWTLSRGARNKYDEIGLNSLFKKNDLAISFILRTEFWIRAWSALTSIV